MSNRYPPPPTKFGPGGLQAKPATGPGAPAARGVPAPPTQFGTVSVQRQVPAGRAPVPPPPALRPRLAMPIAAQAKAAPPPVTPAPNRRRTAVLQRCMEMTNTGNLDYNGDLIGMDLNDPDVQALLTDLKDNHGYTANMLKVVENLIEEAPVYIFDNPKHLKDFSKNPQGHSPTMVLDDDAAELVYGQAQDFGATFKGPTIKFSGSRVYAVAYSEGEKSVWAMLNSSTGYVSRKDQGVVATWQQHTLPYSFPSNTLKRLKSAGITRPSVLPGNAHAEVNEIVSHAIRALADLRQSPHDVGLLFGSDIKHCAECYWAAHAMWKKGNKTQPNATGCGNRLFARWREPWSGFYQDYGANPFRNPNGTLKTGYAVAEYQPHVLNAAVAGSVGNIYK